MTLTSLKGKTAFITGASSGIGKACAEQLAMQGANLVITARREDRLQALAQTLANEHGVTCLPIILDVRDNDQVQAVFNDLTVDIDILVNNAGLALETDKLQDSDIHNWDVMIDTNVKGLLYVTKAALPRMLKKNSGHIFNIGSIAGQLCYPTGNVYCATKHAVRALSQSMRLDLLGTGLRVTEIAPGAVETEFSEVRWNDKDRAKKFYEGFQPLIADDIADAVIYCATRPTHVNVSEIMIYPQAQASVQIHRAPA